MLMDVSFVVGFQIGLNEQRTPLFNWAVLYFSLTIL